MTIKKIVIALVAGVCLIVSGAVMVGNASAASELHGSVSPTLSTPVSTSSAQAFAPKASDGCSVSTDWASRTSAYCYARVANSYTRFRAVQFCFGLGWNYGAWKNIGGGSYSTTSFCPTVAFNTGVQKGYASSGFAAQPETLLRPASNTSGCNITGGFQETAYCYARIVGGPTQFRAHISCADGRQSYGSWQNIGGGKNSYAGQTCLFWPSYGVDKR